METAARQTDPAAGRIPSSGHHPVVLKGLTVFSETALAAGDLPEGVMTPDAAMPVLAEMFAKASAGLGGTQVDVIVQDEQKCLDESRRYGMHLWSQSPAYPDLLNDAGWHRSGIVKAIFYLSTAKGA